MSILSQQPSRAACLLLFPFFFLLLTSGKVSAMPVFINELHYDNVGADVGEGVELAGPAGTSLQGWRLWFYNGSNGTSYGSLPLSGIFADMQMGYGVLGFSFVGIQNGSPDGIALVDNANQVQQFISYEGAFMALAGTAENTMSQDIGVSENAQTAVGFSLQLTGSGNEYSDFQWWAGESSFGSLNEGQRFSAQPVDQGNVPVGSSGVLLALGLAGLVWRSTGSK